MATGFVLDTELGPEFLIGTETPNKITVSVDGTSVTKNAAGVLSAQPPVFDNTANTITFPSAGGAAAQIINLTPYTSDIFVSGATLDATTKVLTLTDNDAGTPDVVVDLGGLLGVSGDGGNLLTDGTDGKAYFNKAQLDAQTQICTSVFGQQLFRGVTI